MKSVWMKFRDALHAFGAARGGNVAIIFALATLPLIAFVGAALDYSRANQVKATLQSALDATALMLAKKAATDTNEQLQTNAKNYFLALFQQTDVANVNVTANYNPSSATALVLNVTAQVPTTLLNVIGIHNIDMNLSSTSKWGETKLRVALVLDNTGSMAQSGKMPALISATKSLLTQLQNAATQNGDVYVSIIPFVKDVNLGSGEYNSDWIYWGTAGTQDAASPNETDDTSWVANNGTCSVGSYTTRSTCRQHGTCSISGNNSQNSCTSAGQCSNPGETTKNSCTGTKACTNSRYTSQSTCTSHGYTWDYGTWSTGVWTAGVWTPYAPNDSVHGWNGCVMDRGFPMSPSNLSGSKGPDTTNNYDTNVVQPDVTKMASLYAAEQYSSCPQAVMGLSYDWTTMNQVVNSMVANGNTNQAIGLQLGWLSLVGGGPFTAPAMDPNYTYTQVIILLTDGLNTQNRWYTSQTSIDTRQQTTCNNINAAGITLYTIQVNTDNEPTSTLLQNCAGSPGKYPDSSKFFLLTSSSQILNVFQQIGTELTKLRIAQ